MLDVFEHVLVNFVKKGLFKYKLNKSIIPNFEGES